MPDLFSTVGPALAGLFPAFGRALRCIGRGLKKLARPLLYLLLALLLVHIVATIVTGLMLRKELSRIKAAGEALTTRELAPTVPPGQRNAADLYQQAFQALRLSGDDEEILFPDLDLSDPDRLTLAREVVSANADYFSLLDEASRIPACAFPVDWDAGFDMTFPHLAKMRQAARMLGLRAEVLAAAGDLDAGVASCSSAFRMAEHAKQEPTLIAQLVSYAIQETVVPALEHALSKGAPSPQAARQLFDQLAAIDQVETFSRSIQGERTFGLYGFSYVRRAPLAKVAWLIHYETPAPWEVAATALYRTVGRPLLNLDQLTYLSTWRRYDRAFALPWPRSTEQADAIGWAVDRLPTYRAVLTKMIFPVYGRAIWRRERLTAQMRAAQISLALKAYHAEHARYPDSLAELEAAGWRLPTDPFVGEPFHYRRDGDGFVVWSTGQDMDDDGGRPFDQAAFDAREFATTEEYEEAEQDYDLPFRCER
ncbi:MAG: hypothetical protein JSV79_03185 [Armatimonadota bacterium]|nr:MAG: hypothetical protein JSV79_03185 [Armatimonadota bacterium]